MEHNKWGSVVLLFFQEDRADEAMGEAKSEPGTQTVAALMLVARCKRTRSRESREVHHALQPLSFASGNRLAPHIA
jgi:hypothetical protein